MFLAGNAQMQTYKFGTANGTEALHCVKFHDNPLNESPLRGKNPQNRHVSKVNIAAGMKAMI